MSEPIRDFIRQHRSAMDAALPGAAGWSAVERALERLPQADGLEKTLLYERLMLDAEEPRACVWDSICSGLDGVAEQPADHLECFIRQHRADLDAAQPDLRVWGHIEQQLPPAASKTLARRVSLFSPATLLRAAASVSLLLLGVGLGMWYAQRADAPGAIAGMAMGEVSAEYRELEDYYRRDIAGKEERLARFAGHQPEEVSEDLQQMDRVMEELR
ncbi:MAG TPA: hypothetical protein PK971_13840, partial [Saprospiraceae bacterium]|nr:hypothetical protein [Saprospiraceae bacterium]